MAVWLITNFVVMPSLEGEPLLADCYSSMLGQIYSDMTALLIAATEVCEIFRQQFTAAQCSTISISGPCIQAWLNTALLHNCAGRTTLDKLV